MGVIAVSNFGLGIIVYGALCIVAVIVLGVLGWFEYNRQFAEEPEPEDKVIKPDTIWCGPYTLHLCGQCGRWNEVPHCPWCKAKEMVEEKLASSENEAWRLRGYANGAAYESRLAWEHYMSLANAEGNFLKYMAVINAYKWSEREFNKIARGDVSVDEAVCGYGG